MSEFDTAFDTVLAGIKNGDFDEKDTLKGGEMQGIERLKNTFGELRKYDTCTEEKISYLITEWGKRQDTLARIKQHRR